MNRSDPPASYRAVTDGDRHITLGPYRLVERLGAGGMGVVYRGVHTVTGEHVAVKTARGTDRRVVASIRREIEILEQINHPGVVAMHDRGSQRGVPWFAMELLEGNTFLELLEGIVPGFDSRADLAAPKTAPTQHIHEHGAVDGQVAPATLAAANGNALRQAAPRRRFEMERARGLLEIVCRLCQTLSHLHSKGLIHGDLKPSNIFLRVKRRPVLIDFGTVGRFEGSAGREQMASMERDGLVGTLQYMAPEQLRGQLVDARADMYALGCLLYLAVTGQPACSGGDGDEIVSQHLEGAHIPVHQRVANVPDELASLIEQLLTVNPDGRIGHADTVAKVLDKVVNPNRTADESPTAVGVTHLNKPRLVGRSRALRRLCSHLDATRAQDAPLLLIEGRRGLGKTRLAMELAGAAERRGYQVSVASAAPTPSTADISHRPALAALAPAMRAIADYCREQGAEETRRIIGRRGRVLAQYEPSIATLAGCEASQAPVELPARAAKTRAFTFLTETLVAFAKCQRLLIVIDDVHLADTLSVDFLTTRLRTGGLNGVVVAATLSRSAIDNFEALLAHRDVCRVQLEPLAREDVASQVADMLALDDPPEALVDLAMAESGGNPFIVSEYLHAAVDEGLLRRTERGVWRVAGSLAERDFTAGELSVHGQLNALTQRRLAGLDDAQRNLVEMGALLGRRFRVELLAKLTDTPVEQASRVCEELCHRRLFEPADEGFRAADHVREVACEGIGRGRKRRLHRQIARTLERRAHDEHDLLLLAEQWRKAGVASRELCYLEKAAQRAVAQGASAAARPMVERALKLTDALENGRCDPPLRRARLRRLLAMVELSGGHTDRAISLLEGSLADLGFSLPEAPAGWSWLGVRELLKQVGHRLGRATETVDTTRESARLKEALESGLTLFTPLMFSGRSPRAAVLAVMLVNLADRLDESAQYALPYVVLAETFRHLGLEALAQSYDATARANMQAGVAGRDFVGTMRLLAHASSGRGDWARVDRLLSRGLDYSEEVGDRLGYESLVSMTALSHIARDQLDEADAIAARLDELSAQSGNAFGQHWSRLVRCMIAQRGGDNRRALELLDASAVPVEEHSEMTARGYGLAMRAAALADTGECEAAFEVALQALEIFEALTTGGDVNFVLYPLYECLAKAFCGCWRAQQAPAYVRHRSLHHARYLTRRLGKLAERRPAARPGWLIYRGIISAVDGDFARGSKLLSRALREADELGLPYEQRLARQAARSFGTLPTV